jgi:hypothetical protein
MAKKRKKRIWWFPVFSEEAKRLRRLNKITVDDDNLPVLFDDMEVAYGFAVGKRLDVKRDDNGNVVTNEKGYGQLHDHGRITLIGIKGSAINWKNVSTIEKPFDLKGEAIAVGDDIGLNRQTLDRIFEEPEELFERFALSPLAQAGGIEYDKEDTGSVSEESSEDAAESVLSEA